MWNYERKLNPTTTTSYKLFNINNLFIHYSLLSKFVYSAAFIYFFRKLSLDLKVTDLKMSGYLWTAILRYNLMLLITAMRFRCQNLLDIYCRLLRR